MRVLGFTGTRNLDGHEDTLQTYLEMNEVENWLWPFDGYVTGACVGWDAFIGRYLAEVYPDTPQAVIIPSNRSRVDPWWEEYTALVENHLIQLVYMLPETDYRSRNEKIVDLSTDVFYCADYSEEHPKSKRSGTWMTKRIAERAGRAVSGIILNNDGENL